MARWKAKIKSDVVKPCRIDVGHKHWIAHVRYLSPQRNTELVKAARQSADGDNEKYAAAYADLYFDETFVRAEGLTEDIVHMMVEMDEGGDPIPTIGDNGSRTVEDREFIRFLFHEGRYEDFGRQVEVACARMLKVRQAEKEAREKNFEGSSAESTQH